MSKFDADKITKPPWFDDEIRIKKLFSWFYTRLKKHSNRKNNPRKKIDSNFFPHNEDGLTSWELLKSLESQIILISMDDDRSMFDYEWSGATVIFKAEHINILAEWLNIDNNEKLSWQEAVESWKIKEVRSGNVFDFEKLKKLPLLIKNRAHGDVLYRLKSVLLNKSELLTVRQLSAKFFWGDSKVLDKRINWLLAIYPDFKFKNRKIIVNCFLPNVIEKVVFIENQDTYQQLCESDFVTFEKTALVYTAGFRLSSERIRQEENVLLHVNHQNVTSTQVFVDWWFYQSKMTYKLLFWGDLDFSGFGIFKSIKSIFPSVELLLPAYYMMLNELKSGNCHSVEEREKLKQIDPVMTGDIIADKEILPLLRKLKLCVDQESVDLCVLNKNL